MKATQFNGAYPINEAYTKKVAYFSMEFAVNQALKIYSGGLGFLAGSHLRSAYELKQNLVGIGLLWKYGYYDQGRHQDQSLSVEWIEKTYDFLEDTGIKFQVTVHGAPVWVKAWYLNPEIFNTAPLFLLSTDLPENDYLSRTICHKLYDDNESTKLAQYIILGIGGAQLLDLIGYNPEVYHLNEAHALPATFYLLKKFQSKELLKEKLVFTTHTPEAAGNEKHSLQLCATMNYFDGIPIDEIRRLTGIEDDVLDLTLVALRFARLANGVSQLHGKVAKKMWSSYEDICPIISITNAQDYEYWADKQLYEFKRTDDKLKFDDRKKYLKKRTFDIVADQTGKLFDPNILTIVWSRRFAGYKRADLLLKDSDRFDQLMKNSKYPVQIIWAGKPYPTDNDSIALFNALIAKSHQYKNMAVLTGYELTLSKRLKQSADVWLNTPRIPREASGTSGMTAAMNGAINVSTNDGWIPEFAKHDINAFVIPMADYNNTSIEQQDIHDRNELYDLLDTEVLPTYYEQYEKWRDMIYQSMEDVRFRFDSQRMVKEYYEKLYW